MGKGEWVLCSFHYYVVSSQPKVGWADLQCLVGQGYDMHFQAGYGGSHMESLNFGRLRWADCLSYGETLSPLKVQKVAGGGRVPVGPATQENRLNPGGRGYRQ